MSALELQPDGSAVLKEALRDVLNELDLVVVPRSCLIEVGARAVISSCALSSCVDEAYLRSDMRRGLSRRLADEIVKHINPKLLPRESDAEIYEVRVTLLKPAIAAA